MHILSNILLQLASTSRKQSQITLFIVISAHGWYYSDVIINKIFVILNPEIFASIVFEENTIIRFKQIRIWECCLDIFFKVRENVIFHQEFSYFCNQISGFKLIVNNYTHVDLIACKHWIILASLFNISYYYMQQ